jgi:ATP-dependent Clp protease adaptor protein ClpS
LALNGKFFRLPPLEQGSTFCSCPRFDFRYVFVMSETVMPEVLPGTGQEEKTQSKEALEPGYLVICWDDPVNLMNYVTRVFQTVFGWPKAKAEHHMLQVHEQGKSLLTRESLELAEHYVHQLHKYGLKATMEPEQ